MDGGGRSLIFTVDEQQLVADPTTPSSAAVYPQAYVVITQQQFPAAQRS